MNQHYDGKKPFNCEICVYSTSQKGNTNQHKTYVRDGNKPFKFDNRSCSFAIKGKVKIHVVVVHEGKKAI